MRRRAFSLVELLVVLGILALLAGLLYPVIASTRERARSTRCLTQVRQLTLSTLMYVNDWADTYPLAGFGSTHGGQPCFFTLYHGLVPYIKEKRITVCPSDPAPFDVAQALERAGLPPLCPAMGFRETSYMANWCVIETGSLLGDFHPPVRSAQVGFPAETVLYYDGGLTGLPSLFPFIQGRHLERMSVGLADGHARSWQTRQGYGRILRADGYWMDRYCLLEVSAYYRGGIFCETMVIGVVERSVRGEPCWRCPNRSADGIGYLGGNCD